MPTGDDLLPFEEVFPVEVEVPVDPIEEVLWARDSLTREAGAQKASLSYPSLYEADAERAVDMALETASAAIEGKGQGVPGLFPA